MPLFAAKDKAWFKDAQFKYYYDQIHYSLLNKHMNPSKTAQVLQQYIQHLARQPQLSELDYIRILGRQEM